jgi:hypothetical protein
LSYKQLSQFGGGGGGKSGKIETGLVNNLTGQGGYTRSVINGRPVVRDSRNRMVTDPAILDNLRDVGVEGTIAERIEATKVKNAYASLAKDVPNPTPEQTVQYLKRAGVSDARIQQETGVAPGTSSRAPANAPSVAPSAGATTGGAVSRPTTTPGFDINNPPEPLPGERSDVHKARVAEWTKKKDRLEKVREELPKVEGQAQESIATVDTLLTHPGFTDVIGIPNVLTGIYSPPGTDARNFKAIYKQIQGEQFLTAYNNLRGGGQISNTEGQAAKEAVAAMQDPGISEAEFRRNAKIYVDTIKRGVNRQRASVGEPPAYPDVPEAGKSTGGSSVPKIANQAEYEKLAPGTEYIAPDGTKRTKK